MKKAILTTLILIPILLLASCDHNDLGQMRRFNLGYAGEYAVEEAQVATKNLVETMSSLTMPNTTDSADLANFRAKMAAVAKAVEDIKNSKDVENDMRALLNTKVNVTGSGLSSNLFNMSALATYFGGTGESVLNMILGASSITPPEGETAYTYIEKEYGIYPDISLATSPTNVIILAGVASQAFSYKPVGAEKTRLQELRDNLSSGEQSGNGELKKAARNAAVKLSNQVIKPMDKRYDEGYLTYADYIFTGLFAEIVYTFHELMHDLTVPMTEKIARTDGAARIMGYIGTIEYIYDVDFGIVDIINSMVRF